MPELLGEPDEKPFGAARGTASVPALDPRDYGSRQREPHQVLAPDCAGLSSARFEYIDAALVLDARADVRPVNAVFSEEQIRHPLDRRRPVDVQVRDLVGPLVPPLEHEPIVIHAMVVVQMREEGVGDVDGAVTALEEPMMGAWPMVHDDDVITNLEEKTRTLFLE